MRGSTSAAYRPFPSRPSSSSYRSMVGFQIFIKQKRILYVTIGWSDFFEKKLTLGKLCQNVIPISHFKMLLFNLVHGFRK